MTLRRLKVSLWNMDEAAMLIEKKQESCKNGDLSII
jgi:hypothetical protein